MRMIRTALALAALAASTAAFAAADSPEAGFLKLVFGDGVEKSFLSDHGVTDAGVSPPKDDPAHPYGAGLFDVNHLGTCGILLDTVRFASRDATRSVDITLSREATDWKATTRELGDGLVQLAHIYRYAGARAGLEFTKLSIYELLDKGIDVKHKPARTQTVHVTKAFLLAHRNQVLSAFDSCAIRDAARFREFDRIGIKREYAEARADLLSDDAPDARIEAQAPHPKQVSVAGAGKAEITTTASRVPAN